MAVVGLFAQDWHDIELDETTAESIALLHEELPESVDRVLVHILSLAELSLENQESLWRLWRELRARCRVTLQVGEITYDQPIDAVVAELVGGRQLFQFERALRTAVTAINTCYSHVVQRACIDQVLNRLGELGSTVRRRDLERLLQEAHAGASPAASNGATPNPTLLAADFLRRLREQAPGAGPQHIEARVLNYYNGTFFDWDRCWRPISAEEMRARVIKDLQDRSRADSITAKLVGDVLTNLQGLCLVACGNEPLPFFIEEYGPPTRVTKRKLLVLENGMLDLEALAAGQSPELLPVDTNWFGTTVLPFAYDAEATCPEFLQFLRQILERQPDTGRALYQGDNRYHLMQEWMGYTLLCDSRFQKFLIMVGEGNNGKGVLQNLWIKMLGAANVSHVSLDQLSGQFALSPLIGKLANICGDLNEIDSVAEGILKRLTGEDNLTVNRKHQSLIAMAPSCKIIFATNALPRFKDKSRGVWRRLIIMPFRICIAEGEENENLARELEAELPGILNWALRGLQRLLQNRQFIHCEICASARTDHRFDCDSVLQFLDEFGYYPRSDPNGVYTILVDVLYDQYKNWCTRSNRIPQSSPVFSRGMVKLPGVSRERETVCDRDGKRPYFFTGIGRPIPIPPVDGVDGASQNGTDGVNAGAQAGSANRQSRPDRERPRSGRNGGR